MPSATDQLRAALSALGRARSFDGVTRPPDDLISWQRVAGGLVRSYAHDWTEEVVAAALDELANYTKVVGESKPQTLAQLGTPAAERILPTLDRLYRQANSRPGHIPFRLTLCLDQVEKAWRFIDGPRPALESWLANVEKLMREKASSWSPEEVTTIADELTTYSHVIRGGYDLDTSWTLAPLGTVRAQSYLPILNQFFTEEEHARPSRIQLPIRARRMPAPVPEPVLHALAEVRSAWILVHVREKEVALANFNEWAGKISALLGRRPLPLPDGVRQAVHELRKYADELESSKKEVPLKPPALGTSAWRRIVPELNQVYEKDLDYKHTERSLPHPARYPEHYKLQRLRPY
ncbi:hypothetical protein JCM9279_007572 [Rhodotorula babjevae]